MGMTRAKRYANYKGGRKYAKSEEGVESKARVQMDKSEGHEGKSDKEEASQVFREVWERAKQHEGYVEKKKTFLKNQKQWDHDRKQMCADNGSDRWGCPEEVKVKDESN